MRNLVNLKTVPIFTALLATAMLGAGLVTAAASAGTTISAGDATLTTGANGSSTARVRLAEGDREFNAFDITLRFDSHVTHVTAIAPAPGWMLMPDPRMDNERGTVQIIAVRFDRCVADCPLFTASWLGEAAGRTELALAGDANQSLAQAGQYIRASFQAGSVRVTAPASASPSPAGTTPASTKRSSSGRRWLPTFSGAPTFEPTTPESSATPAADPPNKPKPKKKTSATPVGGSGHRLKWW